jgi:hypothetical protein
VVKTVRVGTPIQQSLANKCFRLRNRNQAKKRDFQAKKSTIQAKKRDFQAKKPTIQAKKRVSQAKKIRDIQSTNRKASFPFIFRIKLEYSSVK